jgi:hypothetical protein
MLRSWLTRRYATWKNFLLQGTSLSSLSWSITVSALLGVFPLIGTSNFILAGLALRYRLNLPLMLAISYALYPVQILLLVPYLRLGEVVLGSPATALSWSELKVSAGLGIMPTLEKFGSALLLSTVGWFLTSLLGLGVLYYLIRFVLRKTWPNHWAAEAPAAGVQIRQSLATHE